MLRVFVVSGLLGYCLLIYWLSDQGRLPIPHTGFTYQDKVIHAGAYFIMATLAWRSFNFWFSKPSVLLGLTITFCSLYGMSDEWHQSFVIGRDADIFDWLADTFGASLAAFLQWALSKPWRKKSARMARVS
jgi:VanZ family protein